MSSEAERNDTNEWGWNNCWNTRNRIEMENGIFHIRKTQQIPRNYEN
jgi:hypothetical protein